MNGWKTLTDMEVNADSIKRIEQYCSELLIHAADVEGLCQGIDEELVTGEYDMMLEGGTVPISRALSLRGQADRQPSRRGSRSRARTRAARRSSATSRSSTGCRAARSTSRSARRWTSLVERESSLTTWSRRTRRRRTPARSCCCIALDPASAQRRDPGHGSSPSGHWQAERSFLARRPGSAPCGELSQRTASRRTGSGPMHVTALSMTTGHETSALLRRSHRHNHCQSDGVMVSDSE